MKRKSHINCRGLGLAKTFHSLLSHERTHTITTPLDKIFYIEIKTVNNKTNTIKNSNEIEWISAPYRAQQIVKKGDVLFSTVRPYLKNMEVMYLMKGLVLDHATMRTIFFSLPEQAAFRKIKITYA